jgi:hypothetical protein
MCSEKSDKHRWVKCFIEPAIQKGYIPRFEALEKTLGNDCDDEEDDVSEIDDTYEKVCDVRKKTTKQESTKVSPRRKGTTAKTKKKKKISREAEEKMAEALIAQIRGKNKDGSSSLLTKRAEAFDSLVSQLETKYANGGRKNKKDNAGVADIPPDAFDRIQAKMAANRYSKGKK